MALAAAIFALGACRSDDVNADVFVDEAHCVHPADASGGLNALCDGVSLVDATIDATADSDGAE